MIMLIYKYLLMLSDLENTIKCEKISCDIWNKITEINNILDTIKQTNEKSNSIINELPEDIKTYIESTKSLIVILLDLVNRKVDMINNLLSNLDSRNNLVIELKDKIQNIMDEKKDLELLAFNDNLTGLYNRHKLELLYTWAIEKDRKQWFSIALLDLDYFKEINTKYWQRGWDQVLIYFSDLMKSFFWKENNNYMIFRIWGEEFVIISTEKFEDFNTNINKLLKLTINHTCKIADWRKVNFAFSWSTVHTNDSNWNMRTKEKIEWDYLSKWLQEAKKHEDQR